MTERGEPLSERELDVLRRLGAGESNKAIADGLSISPFTVKTHLRNIYTKLGVSTRTEAMTVALQQGVLTVPVEASAVTAAVAEADAGPGETPTELEAAPSENVVAAGPSRSGRMIGLVALGLLLLLAAALLTVQWRTGTLPAATAQPFTEQALGETRWLSSRALPEARAGRAVVAVGLDVYVIGGETASGVTDDVQVFDTQERTWNRAARKPTAVAMATAADLFGELYVPGGRAADGRPTAIVEAYSPSQNAWRRVASLPEPVEGGLAVSEGGYLYLFGGQNTTGPLDSAYMYDPAADSWRPLASMPEPRSGASGGALAGTIYVVGGSYGDTARPSCFVYAPSTDGWETCPEMLQPRAGAGATVLLNKLYVIGGTGVGAAESAEYGEVYDPNGRTWTVLNEPPDTVSWVEPGVAQVETRIYAIGGRMNGALSDANLIYSPLAYQTYIPAAPSDSDE